MDYINTEASVLFIMRHLAGKGYQVAKSIAEIADHVSYAKEHEFNVVYCTDCESGSMYHAALTYYNFHEVEEIWISGAEIDHEDMYGDRIGKLKVYRSCHIMRNSYSEERNGRRMWKLVRITLNGPDT